MKKTMFMLMTCGITLMAFDGESVYKKCAMCHGKQGEKVALNSSPRLNTLNQEQLATKITALLDGSSTISSRYLGMHKAKLKGVRQDDTAALASYILNLQK